MLGDERVQDLINVHFRTNGALSRFLMRRRCDGLFSDDRAMLHFVYNPGLVGVFVCHDGNEGEWVLQIPFFPPFQTTEDNFDEGKVRDMIWTGLLGAVPRRERTEVDEDEDDFDFEVLSVRPWTMSCLVAERYLAGSSGNVALVGDAAHAFPPAGGFGMNTGLQDAHNVAWRIALSLRSSPSTSNSTSTSTSKNDDDDIVKGEGSAIFGDEYRDLGSMTSASSLAGVMPLAKYEEERRPIATQNAALSLRNYKRTLRIAEACYLDARHPRLLISLLSSPPANLLPMGARREAFHNLVRAAMSPLGGLISAETGGPSSFHADRIETNVRRILESGGSLPLVFPRYELGFSYGQRNDSVDRNFANDEDEFDDAAGYAPRLKVGHRMPHVLVEAATPSDGGKNGWDAVKTRQNLECNSLFSLTDISSEMRRVNSSPCPLFTILAVGPAFATSISHADEIVCLIAKRWNVPIILVQVLPRKLDDVEFSNVVSIIDIQRGLSKLLRREKVLSSDVDDLSSRDSEHFETVNALIMVRPDGHIANVAWINERESRETTLGQIQREIEQGLENALGMRAC
ncbi:hypothetical protein ACHAW5_010355 [Stephanodiscus triporus]|uniref:FAD-binding domain-containing protein n=1 Tax=Stephanodiscus triporus TaxID=2934178 RepID=A0ABD3N8C0_9STRA